MWYRYLTLIVAVTCFCLLHQTKSQRNDFPELLSSQNRYCGPHLADMLSLLCRGRYNGKMHKKSSYDIESEEDYEFVPQQQYLTESRSQFPFRTRAKAATILTGTFRRYVRGVYDECCKKACAIKELLSYCAGP